MFVTASGIVMLVSPVQFSKAAEPMLETLFGGAEQRDSFVESFMDEDGIVPIGRLADGFQELLTDLKEKKKDLKN